MKKLINLDLVPNFENDDFEIIQKIYLGKYQKEELEKAKNEVIQILKNYFPDKEVYFFNSARSALTLVLSSLPSSSKVITQAFSCLVVPNSIKFANCQPLFIDIDETFNLDIDDLKRKFDKDVKAIIIQNTFGLPANLEEILNFAKENDLLVIENLTHSLGAKYKENYLGNFGDVALLSFNRNKVISSIIGGALIINKQSKWFESIYSVLVNKKLEEFNQKEIKKIALTGILLYKLKKDYNFLNKAFVYFLRKLKITLEMISSIEKRGEKPQNYFAEFPLELFPLLLNQLKKLERFNQHRREIAKVYLEADLGEENLKIKEALKNLENFSEPIYLRYPIIVENRNKIYEKLKNKNIYLGDWYFCPLAPCVNNLEVFGYQKNFCPQAEKITQKILNLPTYIDIDQETALEILEKIKND